MTQIEPPFRNIGGKGKAGGRRRRRRGRGKSTSVAKVTDPRLLAIKSKIFGPMSMQVLAGKLLPLFDLKTLQEAPQHSVWVYAAVYRIAASLARIKPRLVERGTENEAQGPAADRIRRTLRRVNDHQSWYTFAFSIFIHKKLDGEAWIEKGRNKLGEVNRLFCLNPSGIRAIPGKDRLYERFEYAVGAKTVHFSVDDIIPIINYNPRSPWRGLSPTAPIRREIQTDLNALLFLLSLLQNMGRPGGILQPREGEFVGEEEFKALADDIRMQIGGVQKAGDMLVMPSGFEYKQQGWTLEELKLIEARKWSRIAVAAAYGASPLMMNDQDAATYNNTENQQKAFWDHEGIPELTQFFDSLNEFWIHPEVDEEIELVPDMRMIAAIIDNDKARTSRASTLFQGGILTMNEGRSIVGLDRVDGGDVFAIPANLQLVTVEQLAAGELPQVGGRLEELGRMTAAIMGNAASNGASRTNGRRPKAEGRNDEEARAMRDFHENALKLAEHRFARRVFSSLQQQGARVAKRMREVGLASEELVDQAFDVERESLALYRDLLPAAAEVIETASTGALIRLGAERRTAVIWTPKDEAPLVPEIFAIFDLGNPRILDYLRREFYESIVGATEKTRADIMQAVVDGLAEGETGAQIGLRIQQSASFSEFRANRIARTEVNSAFNLGVAEAFRAAGTARRSWLTAGIGDVRDSHLDLEVRTSSEPIRIDELFEMRDVRGSADLRWPADSSAPGWASIHCRCSQVPEQEEQRAFYAMRCKERLWQLN